MKNGFARYYTPLCFWALAPFQRPSSLSLAIRRPSKNLLPSKLLSYTSTPPFGSVKVERRRMLDDDDDDDVVVVSLERERKLEGYLICFFGLSTYKAPRMEEGVKSICHTQCGREEARIKHPLKRDLCRCPWCCATITWCRFFRQVILY